AEAGDPVLIEDWQNNEFRALVKLAGFADRYLYISRAVDGDLLSLLDDTPAPPALDAQLHSPPARHPPARPPLPPPPPPP
ncbi:MAG: hypothetical protein KDD95_07600, partial [Rhodobacteraceae bacterium]|nr:hypothetical protein [Paracoccaceae bacterium]